MIEASTARFAIELFDEDGKSIGRREELIRFCTEDTDHDVAYFLSNLFAWLHDHDGPEPLKSIAGLLGLEGDYSGPLGNMGFAIDRWLDARNEAAGSREKRVCPIGEFITVTENKDGAIRPAQAY